MLLLEFTHNSDPSSLLVRAAERAIGHSGPEPLAGHVRGIIDGMGYESTPGPGVHAVNPDTWLDPCRAYRIDADEDAERRMWGYLEERIGDTYSWRAVWLTLWYGVTGRPEKFDGNPKAHFDCATLWLGALRAGGLSILPGVDLCDVSPTCLERAIAAMAAHPPR